MNIATIKQRQQAAWASGDYAAVGTRLLLTAELLCEAVDLRAGEHAGRGLRPQQRLASRRFCQVTGIDYVPPFGAGPPARRRRRAGGDLQEADAEALPFSDDSFDAVLSTCGAMFAPDQERTAGELLPGSADPAAHRHGQLGPRRLRWVAVPHHRPLPSTPARGPAPVQWGSEERLRELFGPGVTISAPGRPSCGAGRRPSTRAVRHLLRTHQQEASPP